MGDIGKVHKWITYLVFNKFVGKNDLIGNV